MKQREKPVSKIVRPLAKGQITIPAEFRERLGIDADTLLNVTLLAGKLEITPVTVQERGEALRDYIEEEIEAFLAEDRLDEETAGAVRRLLAEGKL